MGKQWAKICFYVSILNFNIFFIFTDVAIAILFD